MPTGILSTHWLRTSREACPWTSPISSPISSARLRPIGGGERLPSHSARRPRPRPRPHAHNRIPERDYICRITYRLTDLFWTKSFGNQPGEVPLVWKGTWRAEKWVHFTNKKSDAVSSLTANWHGQQHGQHPLARSTARSAPTGTVNSTVSANWHGQQHGQRQLARSTPTGTVNSTVSANWHGQQHGQRQLARSTPTGTVNTHWHGQQHGQRQLARSTARSAPTGTIQHPRAAPMGRAPTGIVSRLSRISPSPTPAQTPTGFGRGRRCTPSRLPALPAA
jgi:hypothetical protein